MTSGAIQYGDPANVWRLAIECVNWTDSPKSASLEKQQTYLAGDERAGGVSSPPRESRVDNGREEVR